MQGQIQHRLLSFMGATLLAIGLLWGSPLEANAQRFPFNSGPQGPTQVMQVGSDPGIACENLS